MLTCKNVETLMEAYMEGLVSEDERVAVQQHIESCDHCRLELDDLLLMKEVMAEMPLMPLPERFTETLHEKLLVAEQEVQMNRQSLISDDEKHSSKGSRETSKVVSFNAFKQLLNSKRTWQMTTLASAACLILVIGIQNTNLNSGLLEAAAPQGVENSVADSATANKSAGPVTFDASVPSPDGNAKIGTRVMSPSPEVTTTFGGVDSAAPSVTTTSQSTQNRDLIYNGTIGLEVANQEAVLGQIKAYLGTVNGYIENSSFGENPIMLDAKTSGLQKYGNLVLRVPADAYTKSFDFLKNQGKVTSQSEYVSDVTQVMSDLEATLKNLKAREDSLRNLLKQAKTIAEIMSVDKEITSVQTEIDQVTSQLKQNSEAVALSTITVSLTETVPVSEALKSTEGSFVARALRGLDNTLQYTAYYLTEGVLWVISVLPLLIVGIPVAYLGFRTLRKRYLAKRKQDL